MCSSNNAEARLARQQRLQARYDRKLKRYGVSPIHTSESSQVTVPVTAPETGVDPPAYSSIDTSTGPRDLPPSVPRLAPTLMAPGPIVPVLHVKVPKVPIMNDPYQHPELYTGEPKGMHESCLKGQHDGKRVYGVGGLVGGVLFFPFGLFWTKCDSRLICRNCGLVMLGPHHTPHPDLEKAQLYAQPAHAAQPSIRGPVVPVVPSSVIKAQ